MIPPNFTPAVVALAAPLIRGFEAYRAKPYLDTAKLWTIGYGNRCDAAGRPVTYHTPAISMADAVALQTATVEALCPRMEALVTRAILPCQAAALLSLDYNIGTGAFASSTLLRLLNTGDMLRAGLQFLAWNRSGGVVTPGLVARRAQEMAVWDGHEMSPTGVLTAHHPQGTTAPQPEADALMAAAMRLAAPAGALRAPIS